MTQNDFNFIVTALRNEAERLVSEIASNANELANLKKEAEQKTTKKESK